METPIQLRAQDRQRRILDAAMAVFARRGYRAASVDEIVSESGTSKGGIYFHFPGKEAIFRALLDFAAKRLLDRIQTAIDAETDPIAKADAALVSVLNSFSDHRALARLFMVEALGAGSEFNERMAEMRAEFAAVIEKHLSEAVSSGAIAPLDTAVASRAWFGALNEIILAWLMTETPGRLEDSYASLRPLLMRSVGLEPEAVPARNGRKS